MDRRKIIHVDMDAFYASVEQRDNPALRAKPIAVGGSPEGRGVVCSASYEARKFGVRSAMTARRALKLCPDIVFVRPEFSKYQEASRKIRGIFFEVTSLVEPLSLDEAYLDVTENKLGQASATTIAVYIRERIRNDLHLTASAGVAPNKFLAKLASDMKKPDGLFVIPPNRVTEILRQLPVEKLWGVGPATADKLHQAGYFTTEDLRRAGRLALERRLGKMGGFLFNLAHGEDARLVRSDRELKSRGSETTFHKDVTEREKLEQTLDELALDVSQGLIKHKCRGHTITLKIRYQDFVTITRSRTMASATDEPTKLAAVAKELLSFTEVGVRAVRLIGISVHNFVNENDPEQLWMDLGQ